MSFQELAALFQQIEDTSSRLGMTEILSELFGQTSAQEAQYIAYLTMGVLNPPYVGTQFNLADKHVATIVARTCSLELAQIHELMRTHGDLGAVIDVCKGSQGIEQQLSVSAVYENLHAIEQIAGAGSQELKIDHMCMLLQSVDALCAKYIVRIVTGKLRLGFSDMTMIDAVSWMLAGNKSLRPAVEEAYNRCADIGRIVRIAKESGIDGLKAIGVTVGIPIRMAAAERAKDAQEVIDKIGPSMAQPKLDGFRLQIHVDRTGGEPVVHFFSRNLLDMSSMFPDLVLVFKNLPVDTIICEGEAIAYEPNTGKFVPFQETVKRKRKHDIQAVADQLPLQVFLFDILFLNGQEVMNQGQEARRALIAGVLDQASSETRAVVSLIEEVRVTTAHELEEYFVRNVDGGLEGLVIKKPNAIYQPGKRNFNWIKLKRIQGSKLEDTIDVVIVGYYYGQGKRAKFGIGALLVAVYNKQEDLFQTVAKIGTGLSDSEWVDARKRCDAYATDTQPVSVVCHKDLAPDVWVKPEIVCQVCADEITVSPLHAAGLKGDQLGLALRFPRFIGYRPDKSPNEVTTAQEIRELYQDQF